jgi:hypothetical protein
MILICVSSDFGELLRKRTEHWGLYKTRDFYVMEIVSYFFFLWCSSWIWKELTDADGTVKSFAIVS